ncbi:beta-agarase [Aporhodopirellula aestuarii]|uniref:Beta-agarase n=1 Tax=Aporhodopirellula aestuarii TaxID=2950107 RepID=A0ABT0TX24_9BACT|nr:beta-agarase [Aporhodopirellula aestuarii]MCM2369168.1 beta-agarase [Aporhodopirellula aestuarii]
MNRIGLLGIGIALFVTSSVVADQPVMHVSTPDANPNRTVIVVEPQTTRAIQGISEVERKRYFNLCDPGTGFEQRVKDDAMYDYLVKELGVSFGRRLGVVKHPAMSLREDPDRPGFPDITPLKTAKVDKPSQRMLEDFGPNLNVAAHGHHNAFPEYMGRFETKDSVSDPKHAQFLPQNIEAAALLSAAVLRFDFNDFDRPKFYEPVNEPHWSFPKTQHLADWHLETMRMVHRATPGVKVGGPCLPVCYFYRGDYKSFDGLKGFIERTDAQLDFYSFHTYDYLRWRDGEFKGRIQSGLPLEGTLDLVQNYTVNAFGKEVDIVISEQGGYIGSDPKGEYDGEYVAAEILAERYPDADPESWDYELKKRSIVSFGHVSSIVANTLTFLEHPHCVQKTVPFLLPNTWSWGPKYYAQLYVAKDYVDETQWVESDMTMYFKLFRGVAGRRVKALCSDPDLQTRAFVDGSKLFLAINNQSFQPESVDLRGIKSDQVVLRRFGRNPDFTCSYAEETIATPTSLALAGRETVVIVADSGQPIEPNRMVNEVVCYGDKVTQSVQDATFVVGVPQDKPIDYAQLRIGLTRSPESIRTPVVRFNGEVIDVALEDSAERFLDREYATTKLIPLDPAKVKAENTISVSFPDGNDGAVGSVVIRAAVVESLSAGSWSKSAVAPDRSKTAGS